MSYRDQLLYMLRNNQQVMKKLIDDISEEESLERGQHGFNHIRWQVGHLLYAAGYSYSLLDEGYDEYKQYKEAFGGGSEIPEETSAYPSMVELREKIYDIHQRMIQAMEKTSDDVLTREVGEEDKKAPAWFTINFLSMHEFYHAGQITQICKILSGSGPSD